MENVKNSAFQFKDYKIKKSLIEIKAEEIGNSFDLSFAPIGKIDYSQSCFTLDLGVSIKDENNNLSIEIIVVANFQFDNEMNSEVLNKFFYMNAPALLFPYVRAYISTLTTLSGISPINLPTLNMSSLGKELEKNTSTI